MLKTIPSLSELQRIIKPLLKKYNIQQAYVFGSYARGEADSSSDLDIAVEITGKTESFDLIGLQQDLEEKLKIEVDVVTLRSMHPKLRANVKADLVSV